MYSMNFHQRVAFLLWSLSSLIKELYHIAVVTQHECLSGHHESKIFSENEFLIEESPNRLQRHLSQLLIFLLVVSEHCRNLLDSEDPIHLGMIRFSQAIRNLSEELNIPISRLPSLSQLLGSTEPAFRENGENIPNTVEAGRILGTLELLLSIGGNLLWHIPVPDRFNEIENLET